MKRIVLIILSIITFASISCSVFLYTRIQAKKTNYQVLTSAAELDAALAHTENSPLLVDLRDQKDYGIAHIPSFLNIVYDDNGKRLETWITPYARDKPVILICYAGNRSSRAFERLVLMGFRTIIDYSPGFNGYTSEKGASFISETGSCNCPY